MARHGALKQPEISGAWGAADVQTLQGQMTALQSALEYSRDAVQAFQRQAAANLEASEQRYRDLFNNVPTGMYRLSPTGRILLANAGLLRMLGCERPEQLDNYRIGAPPGISQQTGSEHIIGVERTWARQDGRNITVRESCRAVRDENGCLLYYEGAVEDITGEKKAELFEIGCRQLLERVARNESLQAIINQLVRMLEKQSSGSICTFMVAEGNCLRLFSGESLHPELQKVLRAGLSLELVANQWIHGFREMSTADLQLSPATAQIADLVICEGRTSLWTMPILSGKGDFLGALVSYRRSADRVPAPERHMIETASRLASVAIEHQQLCEDLERQALRDRLTGLPNRLLLEMQLGEKLALGTPVALFWIDLDRFKEINDTLGHTAGDKLLCEVTRRLISVLPADALLARIGGDEFAVLTPYVDLQTAEELANKILEEVQAPLQLDDFELFVTTSVGITFGPEHGDTAAELQRNADAAMYRAKNKGRNAFAVFEPSLSKQARERMELAHNLRRALERKELEIFYQPQIDLAGRIRGVESLLRWRHPVRGLLGPGSFIDIAEETGLIVSIGAWVLEESCRQCVLWNATRKEPLTVAVNVSALQFYFSDLVHVVRTALDNSGLPPECLELEITESLVMRDANKCAVALEELRKLGVTVAIDDFGTGYSSLSYLQSLPVDVLKIDRSFLENLQTQSGAAVLEAITALAHSLGLRVVAEGVERDDQMDVVRRLRVDLAQGYLIGRPAPAVSLQSFLSNAA